MHKTTTYLTLLILTAFVSTGLAQQALRGRITNAGKGIAATVTLLNGTDSTWIRSDLAEENGSYQFKDLSKGWYIVSANALGYASNGQKVLIDSVADAVCDISLTPLNSDLKEVAVVGKKPFLQMSLGKTVVNVEGSAVTGTSTVLDLMRRLPGITVDQAGNISMQGKQGVMVLIDDRPTYLTGDELGNYLKTISADEVAQIELITQPGARYDAAGNSGLVNVVMKKNRHAGWNGSVTGSYGTATYFHREEGLQLNYKNRKLSLSMSCNDMEAIGFAQWKQTMNYRDPITGENEGMAQTTSNAKERFSNTAMRLTANYEIDDKTSVGGSMRGSYHPNVNHITSASVNADAANSIASYNNVISPEGHIRKDIIANAFVKRKFSKDNVLDINLDYLTFSKHAVQDLSNRPLDSLLQPLPSPYPVHTWQPSGINIYSVKADHSLTLKNGMKIETGVKSSMVTTDNLSDVRLLENNVWVNDTSRSNRFVYKENINAAYINLSRSLGKRLDVRAGLRAEQTNADGHQDVHNANFVRSYVSLFPTVYLNYKKDSNNQFELNYGRRIERPSYKDLNPFIYYSFQNTYEVGNPDLQPQYTHRAELKHSYKNMLITTLTGSVTNNCMTFYLQVDDATKKVYSRQRNVGSNSWAGIVVSFNKDVFKWWSLMCSASASYSEFTSVINNQQLHVEWAGYSADMNTQFDFGKGWKAEASVSYVSHGQWSATTSFEPSIYMEGGISKKVNDKLMLRFYANDPLYLYRNKITDHGANYLSYATMRYATQLFSAGFTYNFGKKTDATRNINAPDEAGRVR